jgi:hypothetical protein
MRSRGVIIFIITCTVVQVLSRQTLAESIGGFTQFVGGDEYPGVWDWTQTASASGSANVFDGGPTVFDSDETAGPDDGFMLSSATDRTMLGTMGASARSSGSSRIEIFHDDENDTLNLSVSGSISVSYIPSQTPAGDRPGGESEGSVMLVAEVVIPTDDVFWRSGFATSTSGGYEIEAHVLVENITRNEILADFSQDALIESVFTDMAGDVIRVTFEASGSGTAPAGVGGIWGASAGGGLLMTIIPEPSAASILAAGTLGLFARRRLGNRPHRDAWKIMQR